MGEVEFSNRSIGGLPMVNGGNWGRDNSLLEVIIAGSLFGRRGFGGGDDCDGRNLIIEALKGNHERAVDIAKLMHCDVRAVQQELCDIKAKAEMLGVKMDFVGAEVKNHISEKNCEVKTELLKIGYETQLRDQENLGKVLHHIHESEKALHCRFDKMEEKACEREIQRLRDELSDERRCRKDDAVLTKIENINYGTQQSLEAIKSQLILPIQAAA